MRKRKHFGNAKVQYSGFVVSVDSDIPGFDVAVHDAAEIFALNLQAQTVRSFERFPNVDSDLHGSPLGQRALSNKFLQIVAWDVLHRDKEPPVQIAPRVNFCYVRVSRGKLFLQSRTEL